MGALAGRGCFSPGSGAGRCPAAEVMGGGQWGEVGGLGHRHLGTLLRDPQQSLLLRQHICSTGPQLLSSTRQAPGAE